MDYKKAGVDVEAGYKVVSMIKNSVKKTHNKRVLSNIGSFGALFDIANPGFNDPVLVSGTDGVGTKLKLAFLLNEHNTIGQDLVAMCINDIVCFGAKPLFFLDYIAIEKNEPVKVAQIVKSIAKACKEANCALIGGETAEMPDMYKTNEYDLAGFCVGIVSKSKIPNLKKIKNDDVVIGLPSSGIHSNGFSLVRKIYKKTLSKAKNNNESGNIAKKLLAPTKLYAKSIYKLFEKVKVKSVANITGGGFYENIPRALPIGKTVEINEKSWSVPKIFTDIQMLGNVTKKNMFSTFNMGIGMIVIVSPKDVKKSVELLKSEKPILLGKVITGKSLKFI